MDLHSKFNVGDEVCSVVYDADGVRLVGGVIDSFSVYVDSDHVSFNYYIGRTSVKEKDTFTSKRELLDYLSSTYVEPEEKPESE